MTRGFAAVRRIAAQRCALLSVQLELTQGCNARCAHCFQDPAHAASAAELDAAEWVSILEQARAAGALFVTLSGGEAMLSPHFWTVAEHARRLGLAIRVYTNGLALDRDAVRRLAALRPFSVEVTVFSTRAERHDAVTRVPGSLARAVRGLVRLKRAGVRTAVKCPLVTAAAEDHAAVRRLAERVGADVGFDAAIFPGADGGAAPTRCRGDDAALERYFVDDAARGGARGPAAPRAADAATCGMARTFAVVSAEGDLYPCTVLRTSAGNLRQAPLSELWHAPLMERLRARRFGDLAGCSGCARSGYCGRCSAMALLEDGDLDGPSRRACHIAELRERAWGVRPPGEGDSSSG